MKNLKFLALSFVMLLVTSGVALAVEPTFSTWTDKSANIGARGNPVRVLKQVRLASRDQNAASAASGDVVIYSLISDDGITVAHTATSADGAIAGILAMTILTADGDSVIAQDDAGRRNWGWMVVHGPMTAKIYADADSGAAGDPFYTSRDGSRVAALEAISWDQAGLVTGGQGVSTYVAAQQKKIVNKGGFFMDADSTTATVADVFVMLE